MGKPGLPARVSFSSNPAMLAQMAQPVSVCHQWSITGTPGRASRSQW